MSSFFVNHSANAYLLPWSALLNGNEPNYSTVSGRDWQKDKMKGITFPFCQFVAEFLCHSPVSSLGLCDGISCWQKNLFGFFCKGIWKNPNNFLVNPIIFSNNQSFFSPTAPCSNTHSPILHARPIWLRSAIGGIPPSRGLFQQKSSARDTPWPLVCWDGI